MKIEKLTNLKGKLLEGCVWDEKRNLLFFVDIECRKIYCMNPKNTSLEQMEMPDYVSCIVLEKTGELAAALPDGLYRVDFQKRTYRKLMCSTLEEGVRFNDGKCDAAGRLWIGSMAIVQDEHAENAGALYCVEQENIVETYPDYTIPNGLAWNEEKLWFYHIDTPTKKVDRYEVVDGIRLESRCTAVDLSKEEGSPDGMCMDENGNLWIAMWGGSKVICASPESGEILETIEVPDKNVSCCTFGGEHMNQLYITTARDEEGKGGEVYRKEMKMRGVTANRYGQ